MRTVFFAVNHGKCENILCEYLEMRFRTRIISLMMKDGTETISLRGSANYMSNGVFKDMRSLNAYYREYAKKMGISPKKLRKEEIVIFVLVDVDGDTRSLKSFRSKDLFKDSVFYDNIIPVATNPNLDEVFRNAGANIGERGKTESYREVLDGITTPDELTKLFENSDSDMPRMIDELKKHSPSHQ